MSDQINKIEEVINITTPKKSMDECKDDVDMELFDESVRELLCEVEDIIKDYVGKDTDEVFVNQFKFYCEVYNRTKPEDHYPLFKKVYTVHKKSILSKGRRYNWLRNGNVEIVLGDDKTSNCRIALSSFYRAALNLDENLDRDENYCDRLLQSLYEIFETFAPRDDLGRIKSKLRSFDVSMPPEEEDGSASNVINNFAMVFDNDAFKDLLTNIGNTVTPLIKGLSDDTQQGESIDFNKIGGVIQTAFSTMIQDPNIRDAAEKLRGK